jgi:hypothetical protein
MPTSDKNYPSKKNEKADDSALSKNHSKSVKYRLRVQQEREAIEEIKKFDDKPDDYEELN